jgi:nitrogenase molybdenum-iron protein alpha/beta subunit
MSFEYDRPEGMLGAILAIEGIKDSMTILNGPTGCKYYPASSSEASYSDRGAGTQKYNAFKFFKEFFFSQPRVPCTYLDGNDYIMGSGDKPDRVYEKVMEGSPNIVALVNSPGASLIGETLKLKNEKGPIVRLEAPLPSVPMGAGFQSAVIKVLETISPKKSEKRNGVNLIGISIGHLGWEDSIEDLNEIFKKCDIHVNTTICAGCSVSDIETSGNAELNVLLHRDFGSDIAKWYENNLNIPFIESEFGAPIGFDALEDLVKKVCMKLKADPSDAIAFIRKKRERAAKVISKLFADRNSVRGCTFSIIADGSIAYPVMRFLYSYLGMIPVAVTTGMDNSFNDEIGKFITENGLDVSDDPFNTPADVMIADGNNISSALRRNIIMGGYDVACRGLSGVNVSERPILGLGGTVRLIDGVLTALEKAI